MTSKTTSYMCTMIVLGALAALAAGGCGTSGTTKSPAASAPDQGRIAYIEEAGEEMRLVTLAAPGAVGPDREKSAASSSLCFTRTNVTVLPSGDMTRNPFRGR